MFKQVIFGLFLLIFVKTCASKCNETSNITCVNVCCKHGVLMNLKNKEGPCTDLQTSWTLENLTKASDYHLGLLENTRPECPSGYRLRKPKKNKKHTFFILANGSLVIKHPKYKLTHPTEEFCVGVSRRGNLKALVCRSIYIEYNKLMTALLLIGSVVLLVTILIHAGFSELRNTATGLCLIAHCTFVLTSYLTYIVESLHIPELETITCSIYAYIKLYSVLTGFFWLNVICIDIALKFRSMDTMVESGPLNRRRVMWYSIYAMGCPLLVVLTAIVGDHVDLSESPAWLSKLKTHIGQSYCWFDSDTLAEIAYCQAPLGVLLLMNIGLFIDTIAKIKSFSRKTSGCNQPSELEKQARRNFDVRRNKRLALFAKLLALLGLSWLLEMIVWSLEYTQQHPLWVIIFIVHLATNISTFVLFCCKRTVWRLMTTRFPLLARLHLPWSARVVPELNSSDPLESHPRRRSLEGHVNPSLQRDMLTLGVMNQRGCTL